MGRRNDHSREELRQMIVYAAEKIVAEYGYAGLSMRKVASAIGYTVGTLYLVFRNQDALLFELNARTLDKLDEALEAALADEQDTLERLKTIARAYIRFAHSNRQRWLTAFEHRPPEDVPTPDWMNERIQRSFDIAIRELKPALPDASEEQLQVAASALWSGVHGICVLGMTNKLDSGGIADSEMLAGFLVETMLKGLREG